MRINFNTAKQFLSFSGIGFINTMIYMLVTVTVVELMNINPVIANTIAFVSANIFSYWANSRWSFCTKLSSGRFFKFITVSIMGLLLSISISTNTQAMHWHYLTGVAILLCTMPILSFVLHKSWTYANQL